MTTHTTNPGGPANSPHPVVHVIAFTGGAVIIAAAAHAVCVSTTAYGTSHAILVWAAALAIVAGGVAIASAKGRWVAAIAGALLCGELYALNATAERAIADRDARQAPIRAALATHEAAQARVAAAVAVRQKLAESALEKISASSCRDRCKAEIDQQKADATAEELRARADLARHPKPEASLAPLADRFGVDPAKWDIGVAALAGLGLNGLGAVLVAFASHGWLERSTTRASARGNTVAADAPTMNDTAQTSFAVEQWDNPPPFPPRGPKKRAPKPTASNVVAFPHPVVSALQSAGGTVASNQELARIMGVSEGESTKRVSEVAHLLAFQRIGKRIKISLRLPLAAA